MTHNILFNSNNIFGQGNNSTNFDNEKICFGKSLFHIDRYVLIDTKQNSFGKFLFTRRVDFAEERRQELCRQLNKLLGNK